jgi:hypothetical protein
VQVLGERNKAVASKGSVAKDSFDEQAAALAAQTQQKLDAATRQHQSVIQEKAVRASSHNEGVKVAHAGVLGESAERTARLAREVEERQAHAATNKAANILTTVMDAGKATRDKQERGRAALAAREAEAVKAREEMEQKMSRVTLNRDQIINDKVS